MKLTANEVFLMKELLKRVKKAMIYDPVDNAYYDNGNFILQMDKEQYDSLTKIINKI